MRQFQDLDIYVAEKDVEELLAKIKSRVSEHSDWQEISEDDSDEVNSFKFSYLNQSKELIATLFLIVKDVGLLSVTNVIPKESGYLPLAFYNHIVTNFKNDILDPVLQDWGKPYQVEFGKATVKPDEILPEHLAKLLETFSHMANKSSLHPLDQRRWREFLIKFHLAKCELYTNQLEDMLIQDFSWPGEMAFKLVIEFEQAMDLLKDYDEAIGN